MINKGIQKRVLVANNMDRKIIYFILVSFKKRGNNRCILRGKKACGYLARNDCNLKFMFY